MKRPLIGMVILVFLGNCLGLWGNVLSFFLVLAGICLLIGLGIRYRRLHYWYLLTPFFLILSFWKTTQMTALPESLPETGGIIQKIIEKSNYQQIYVLPKNSCGREYLILYRGDGDFFPGDVVLAQGKWMEYEHAKNPGNFDSFWYYRSLNVYGYLWADEIELVQRGNRPWSRMLYSLRKRLKKVYGNIGLEKDVGIYTSIVLGDKSLLDSSIKDLYQKNGIAHILAISGLHISILGMCLYKILRKCLIPFPVCFLVNFTMIVSYGILTGNSVSTIRAIFMFLISVMADVLGRTYDMLSAVSLAATCVLLAYPCIVYNSGFWLSFLAVCSIALVKPVLDHLVRFPEKQIRRKNKNRLKKVLWTVWEMLSVSLSVNLATFPVLLFFYFEIPTYSVILNLFIIPLLSVLLGSVVVAGIVGLFSVPLGVFFIGIAHFILEFYQQICLLFHKLPKSLLILGKPAMAQIFLYYILLMVILVCYRRNRTIVLTLLGGMLLIVSYTKPVSWKFTMVDVSQGDCFHLRQNKINVLIDGGSLDVNQVGQYRIIPYLKSQGIRQLDYVWVSHADADHVNGITEILEAMCQPFYQEITIKNLMLPDIPVETDNYQKLVNLAQKANVHIYKIHAGQEILVGNTKFLCVYPDALQPMEGNKEVSQEVDKTTVFESENDYSMVLKISYQDFDFLLTGDLPASGEEEVLQNLQNIYSKGNTNSAAFAGFGIEFLKVAHHGSKNSTAEDFLKMIKPQFALISCGKNNRYGHPHEETLKRLEEIDCKILRTDELGAIILTISPSGEVEKEEYRCVVGFLKKFFR